MLRISEFAAPWLMRQNPMNEYTQHLVILMISGIIVSSCVILHYEVLRFMGRTLGAHVNKRSGVLHVMFGLLMIWTLAFDYMFMRNNAGFGYVTGIENGSFIDYVYYLSAVYTTVGFGEFEERFSSTDGWVSNSSVKPMLLTIFAPCKQVISASIRDVHNDTDGHHVLLQGISIVVEHVMAKQLHGGRPLFTCNRCYDVSHTSGKIYRTYKLS